MLKIHKAVIWRKGIDRKLCCIQVKGRDQKIREVEFLEPLPSGRIAFPTYQADRVLHCLRINGENFSVVQAGQGKAAKFALVPQSAVEYVVSGEPELSFNIARYLVRLILDLVKTGVN